MIRDLLIIASPAIVLLAFAIVATLHYQRRQRLARLAQQQWPIRLRPLNCTCGELLHSAGAAAGPHHAAHCAKARPRRANAETTQCPHCRAIIAIADIHYNRCPNCARPLGGDGAG